MTRTTTNADPAIMSEWQPTVSGNAELVLSTIFAGRVPALQMDFDFKGDGGFVVARRVMNRAMPTEYAVHFRLRGRGAVNNLELKLVDATGQNVWRWVKKDLRLPARWKCNEGGKPGYRVCLGPSSGSGISNLGAIEFAIVAGEGGRARYGLLISRSRMTAPPKLQGRLHPAHCRILKPPAPCWALAGNRVPTILGLACDRYDPASQLGGLIIDWLDDAPASGFRVRGSNSGHRWKTLYAATQAGGGRSYVYLPGLKSRFLRLELDEPSAGAAVRLQSFEFSRSIHAFWHHIADAEARGWHPRWLHREQRVWTPIGTSNGTHCALMNDDGMVEVGQGSCR